MGKALVIKNVDFSENALAVVTLLPPVPCESITLNKSSHSFTQIGATYQLTATVTPANTTDVVAWTTSNPKIATVSNSGLITVTGAGTAIITATCGSRRASCSVAVTLTLTSAIAKTYNVGTITKRTNTVKDGQNAVVQFNANTSEHYAIGYSTAVLTKHIMNKLNNEYIYPIYFGHADKLTITVPDTIRATVVFTDSEHTVSENTVDGGAARYVQADENAYDSSVLLGTRIITSITNEADSVAITFHKPNGTIAAADLSSLAVVAS